MRIKSNGLERVMIIPAAVKHKNGFSIASIVSLNILFISYIANFTENISKIILID
jgi:hypothetical protein